MNARTAVCQSRRLRPCAATEAAQNASSSSNCETRRCDSSGRTRRFVGPHTVKQTAALMDGAKAGAPLARAPLLKASNETYANDPLVQEDLDVGYSANQCWARHSPACGPSHCSSNR